MKPNSRPPTPEEHARFLAEVEHSQEAVWTVAQWLNRRGKQVQVNVAGRAPTPGEALKYSDNGDLSIVERVEVKRLTYDFTGRHDWPFGDKFIVCARHAFDRAVPKPHRYVILNPAMTHAAIVRCEHHARWTVEERADARFGGRRQELYFCPIELVTFIRLDGPTGSTTNP